MKTILLIDDEEDIRFIFGAALREYGYRVIEASSGQAGLDLAHQQIPDLILIDIDMPGMGGEAVLKHIRQDSELSNKRVVLMTGDPGLITPAMEQEAAADDFLIKPFSRDDLLQCMEAHLPGSE
jgi:CheY-like chemotaxis protein